MSDKSYHVYPIDDLKEHDLQTPNCWCKPTIETVNDISVIVHNALDEREKYEGTIN